MDFSKLSISKSENEKFKFEVLHPISGDGTGTFLEVLGSENSAVRKHHTALLRKAQKQDFENLRTNKPKFDDLEELREQAIENALVRLVGWENLEWDGKELEFTTENARKVLTACPWMCAQIVKESDYLGNFLKA